jgi:hypothetical protein
MPNRLRTICVAKSPKATELRPQHTKSFVNHLRSEVAEGH